VAGVRGIHGSDLSCSGRYCHCWKSLVAPNGVENVDVAFIGTTVVVTTRSIWYGCDTRMTKWIYGLLETCREFNVFVVERENLAQPDRNMYICSSRRDPKKSDNSNNSKSVPYTRSRIVRQPCLCGRFCFGPTPFT
jgi:hypothetical protein